MAFVCYLLLNEANIHINLICFDRNFDHPNVNVVTFVPRKQSIKPDFLADFFNKNMVLLLKKSSICICC